MFVFLQDEKISEDDFKAPTNRFLKLEFKFNGLGENDEEVEGEEAEEVVRDGDVEIGIFKLIFKGLSKLHLDS